MELPEESLRDLQAIKKAKEAVVLELLKPGEISQGKAAELLEIDRWSLLDLMAKDDIPMADFSVEELGRQVKEARR